MIELRCAGYTAENWKQLALVLERGLAELCPKSLEHPDCKWDECPGYKVCSDVARSVRYAEERAEGMNIDKKVSNTRKSSQKGALDKNKKV